MLVYWLMFLIPAWAALMHPQARLTMQRKTSVISWFPVWIMLTVLIGYRFKVGGDWINYFDMYLHLVGYSFTEALEYSSDPAYGALTWLAIELEWGIYGVNLISGALFSWGLLVFCRDQPRPWLALLVAIPYLVIVVGMGYSRQAVAIGLIMPGLVALRKKDNMRFVLWVCLAALFHKSAVILLPLPILASSRGRWWTAMWVGTTALLAYVLLLQDHVDTFVENYIGTQYSSQGALIRIAMNAVPAFLFLLYRRRLEKDSHIRSLWTWMSLIALAFIVLFVISPSSTAIDRLALYFIPIQLFVFSRLPDLWGRKNAAQLNFAVVIYYALVQFVWLNFAAHAYVWLPYRFYWFN
jgi:hypothetical protein